MKVLSKLLSLLVVALALAFGSSYAFSATCPLLVAEIRTGTIYGIILKDTESRGLSGMVAKVDTSKCMVTIKYAEEKVAIVDGHYIIVILENP